MSRMLENTEGVRSISRRASPSSSLKLSFAMPSALLGPLGTLARTITVHACYSSQGKAGCGNMHRHAGS